MCANPDFRRSWPGGSGTPGRVGRSISSHWAPGAGTRTATLSSSCSGGGPVVSPPGRCGRGRTRATTSPAANPTTPSEAQSANRGRRRPAGAGFAGGDAETAGRGDAGTAPSGSPSASLCPCVPASLRRCALASPALFVLRPLPADAPAHGLLGRPRQGGEVPGEVRVQAHVLDVIRLGLGVRQDQFLQPPHLLGGDGVLAQGVEEAAQ